MFRKILAVIVAILIFALVFLAVKFTKVEVPNFNRNLIMLAVVDISAFGLVMWKFGCPTEKKSEEKQKVESVAKEEVAATGGEKETETTSNKTKESGETEAGNDVEEEAEAEDGEDGDDVEEEAAEVKDGEESESK